MREQQREGEYGGSEGSAVKLLVSAKCTNLLAKTSRFKALGSRAASFRCSQAVSLWPMDCSTTHFASWLGSRGRLPLPMATKP